MPVILKNFWVLEGLDGSGTTTQLKKLSSKIESLGLKSFITCEPTQNATGLFLRKILGGEIKVEQSTVSYMFACDRDDHLNNSSYGILYHLNNNEIVISDRYFFSSFAYQGVNVSFEEIDRLNSSFPYPECVIYVDTPVDDCMMRIEKRAAKKEIYEKYEYQIQVQKNYEKCFKNLPSCCRLIRVDGIQSPDAVFKNICDELKDFFYCRVNKI